LRPNRGAGGRWARAGPAAYTTTMCVTSATVGPRTRYTVPESRRSASIFDGWPGRYDKVPGVVAAMLRPMSVGDCDVSSVPPRCGGVRRRSPRDRNARHGAVTEDLRDAAIRGHLRNVAGRILQAGELLRRQLGFPSYEAAGHREGGHHRAESATVELAQNQAGDAGYGRPGISELHSAIGRASRLPCRRTATPPPRAAVGVPLADSVDRPHRWDPDDVDPAPGRCNTVAGGPKELPLDKWRDTRS